MGVLDYALQVPRKVRIPQVLVFDFFFVHCRICLRFAEEGPDAHPVLGVKNLPALGFFVPVFLKLLEVIHLQLSAFLLAPDERPILVDALLDDFKGHRAAEIVVTDRELVELGGGGVIHYSIRIGEEGRKASFFLIIFRTKAVPIAQEIFVNG
jgi:hypothetical protein